MSQRILLVEDDQEIAGLLADRLREHCYEVATVSSGAAMDRQLQRQPADVIVLDVMLPGEDGFSICRRLRTRTQIPILMLTARSEEVDRVVGLEIGADDYVSKPFSTRELIARIKALLRRARHEPDGWQSASVFSFTGWRLEAGARQLFDPHGVRVSLTSMEFDLLLALCRNPGRVLSRDELLECTHNGLAGPVARSVDVHISRIRQKIETGAAPLIKTVRLGGYVFTPQVTVQ